MKQYKHLLHTILSKGRVKETRTGKVIGVHSHLSSYDLREGFPIVTIKKTYFSSIVKELQWFLSGNPSVDWLLENNVNIWNDDLYRWFIERTNDTIRRGMLEFNGYPDNTTMTQELFFELLEKDDFIKKDYGSLGRIYPHQWRSFNGKVDQIKNLIEGLKDNPLSRYHVVTAWNPDDLQEQAIGACHMMFTCNAFPMSISERITYSGLDISQDIEVGEIVSILDNNNVPKYYLDMTMIQRSGDSFLGIPFNISSYALLLELVARKVNMIPKHLHHHIIDAHIYVNHIPQVEKILERNSFELPQISFDGDVDVLNFDFKHVKLHNYEHHAFVKGKLNVGLDDKCEV